LFLVPTRFPCWVTKHCPNRPTRFEAQSEAVSLIFTVKTQANAESSVGLMSMGGKGPEVLVTLTMDFGKILDGLHRTKIRGNTHLTTGIQVAGVSFYYLPPTLWCPMGSRIHVIVLSGHELTVMARHSLPLSIAKISPSANELSYSSVHQLKKTRKPS